MARTVTPLTDPKCEASRHNPDGKGNKLADGGGLFLLLKPTGSKSWRMKYTTPSGKEDLLVFGDYPAVGLKAARNKRAEAESLLAKGIDPKEDKRERAVAHLQAQQNTFEAVATDWHRAMTGKWSEDYAARVWQRVKDNLLPDLGKIPVTKLKARDLLVPIRKIEKRGFPDIAKRMRQAVTSIMSHATVEGFIDANPATSLQTAIIVHKSKRRPALPLDRLPELLQRIEGDTGKMLTRMATELALLVFIRSSELRFARWDEIDFARAIWTIPGERKPIVGVKFSRRGTKMGTPHQIPLSRQALALLESLRAKSGRFTFIFPGQGKSGAPLSEGTVNKALQRMGYDTKVDVCGHGFRTMACGALGESALWQKDAVERQMSHQERDEVRGAYIHMAEFMQERRLMLQWWADYLDANRVEHITPYDFAHPGAGAENVVLLAKQG